MNQCMASDVELRMLILEDVPEDAELMERELRKAGILFTSRRVDTEQGFINELDGFQPHIILADFNLPSYNGLAALKEVRNIDKEIPFILVSGMAGEELAIEILKKGATDYVLKDRLERLGSVVERALREDEQRAARARAEAKLKESEEHYRTLAEAAHDMIFVVGRDGQIQYLNNHAAKMSDLSPEKIIGRPLEQAFPDNTGQRSISLQKAFTGESVVYESKVFLSEEEAWLSTSLVPVRFRDGEVEAVLGISRDITTLKRAEAELLSMSLTDDLTGLNNRRGFMTLARQQLKLISRNGKAALLIYADIDGMKGINDTLGHPMGDKALRDIAEILRKTFRESDVIARIGGDEFAVLAMENSSFGQDAIRRRLQEGIDAYNAGENGGLPHLALSLGILCCEPGTPVSLEHLLLKADELMYQDKHKNN